MASLNEIESFLNIEIGDKKLRDGKKRKNKNQYYYYEQAYYIVKLTRDKWMILEDCRKTRELLKKHCWHADRGYAMTNVNKSTSCYHKLFLNYDEDLMADHINNKRFDNRLNNLRIVTPQENMKNKTKYSNNTSGKQGVYFNTDKKKGLQYWVVQIYNNGKKISKKFSIKKLGNDEAKRQAIAYRKQLELQFGYLGD